MSNSRVHMGRYENHSVDFSADSGGLVRYIYIMSNNTC